MITIFIYLPYMYRYILYIYIYIFHVQHCFVKYFKIIIICILFMNVCHILVIVATCQNLSVSKPPTQKKKIPHLSQSPKLSS